MSLYKTNGKTKKKMGGCRPEGHVTDPGNTTMEETSRRQRRMEASSERGQGPEGAVAPHMEWNEAHGFKKHTFVYIIEVHYIYK
jgi:hypothetical protein